MADLYVVALVHQVEDNKFLLVGQPGDEANWSFPKGRIEKGESVREAVSYRVSEQASAMVERHRKTDSRTETATGDHTSRYIAMTSANVTR